MRVTVTFKSDVEEGLILAVVNLRNPDLAAEAAGVGTVGLFLTGDVVTVVEVVVAHPFGVADVADQSAVVSIAATLQ